MRTVKMIKMRIEAYERKMGPGTPSNTEEPQGTHRRNCTFL